MSKLRTLRVFANPYHHLDHEGRPSGVLPFEPEGNGVTTFDARRFVGATLQATITRTPADGEAALHPEQDTSFEFADEPTVVPDTAFYRFAVARGELVAADAECARRCGVQPLLDEKGKPKPYSAGECLEAEKAKALAKLAAEAHEEHGPDHADALKAHTFGPMKAKAATKAPAPQPQAPKGGE